MTELETRLADDSTLRRWLAPSFTALLFLIHPVITLLDPSYPLQDPGTGWHLAAGRHVLETGTIPTHDLFSFTARGREWISYYWLFDMIGAWLEKLGGLPLYAAACVLVYAFLPVLLFRRMVRMGAGLLPAFVLTLIAYLVLWSHALARPHIVTYVFFALFLERLDDHRTGRLPSWRLWWLPLLALVWCNVHGGFVAGIGLVGIFAAAAAARATLVRDRSAAQQSAVLGALLVATLLATLANPRGATLHVSIIGHLGQASAQLLPGVRQSEFRGAQHGDLLLRGIDVADGRDARSASAATGVGGGGAARLLPARDTALGPPHEPVRDRRRPVGGAEISPPLARIFPAFDAACRRIVAEQLRLRSPILYLPVICAVFLSLTLAGRVPFPHSLDGLQLSKAATEFIATHEEYFGRLFNTDNVGGSLIYRFWPRLHVFVDDRIFVYGDDFIAKRYLAVYSGRKEWRKVLDKYRITSAVLAASAPGVTLFRDRLTGGSSSRTD